jgi:hypothetical protein
MPFLKINEWYDDAIPMEAVDTEVADDGNR